MIFKCTQHLGLEFLRCITSTLLRLIITSPILSICIFLSSKIILCNIIHNLMMIVKSAMFHMRPESSAKHYIVICRLIGNVDISKSLICHYMISLKVFFLATRCKDFFYFNLTLPKPIDEILVFNFRLPFVRFNILRSCDKYF